MLNSLASIRIIIFACDTIQAGIVSLSCSASVICPDMYGCWFVMITQIGSTVTHLHTPACYVPCIAPAFLVCVSFGSTSKCAESTCFCACAQGPGATLAHSHSCPHIECALRFRCVPGGTLASCAGCFIHVFNIKHSFEMSEIEFSSLYEIDISRCPPTHPIACVVEIIKYPQYQHYPQYHLVDN